MRIKRILLVTAGFIFLGLGAVGAVIPVLPTTPFVLAAAGCFSASNVRFHAWLCRNRVFGQYIDNYRTKRGISLPLKTASVAFLWAGLIISAVLLQNLWAYIILPAAGICVTVHILMIKTKRH